MKRLFVILVTFFCIACFTGCTDSSSPPTEPEIEEELETITVPTLSAGELTGVFAIKNSTGDQLITFSAQDGTISFAYLDTAISYGIEPTSINYISEQMASAEDSGRITSDNFDNLGGHVYQVASTTLAEDQSYYLFNSDTSIDENIMPGLEYTLTEPLTHRELSSAQLATITSTKGRNALNAWILESHEDDTQIVLVLFESIGSDHLMSIALKQGENYKFMDYPVTTDGYSVWRVDDGGTIDPRFFTVLFSVQTTSGVVSCISWAGAEGESIFFLTETATGFEELGIYASRYWAPF